MAGEQTDFVERLLSVFGSPKTDDVDGYVRAYVRMLKPYDGDELNAAADTILTTRKYSTWPTIAECVNACEDARREIERRGGIPEAGVPGTGWRLSESGARYYQIEKGSREWAAWMRFYRENGRAKLAAYLEESAARTWVRGPSPIEHGGTQIATLDRLRPKRMLAGDEA